jgi:hypothetical protein
MSKKQMPEPPSDRNRVRAWRAYAHQGILEYKDNTPEETVAYLLIGAYYGLFKWEFANKSLALLAKDRMNPGITQATADTYTHGFLVGFCRNYTKDGERAFRAKGRSISAEVLQLLADVERSRREAQSKSPPAAKHSKPADEGPATKVVPPVDTGDQASAVKKIEIAQPRRREHYLIRDIWEKVDQALDDLDAVGSEKDKEAIEDVARVIKELFENSKGRTAEEVYADFKAARELLASRHFRGPSFCAVEEIMMAFCRVVEVVQNKMHIKMKGAFPQFL